jgi:integrase/recombinase XerD
MNALGQHSEEYLAIRRALGYKLVGEGHLLASYVAFAERAGTPVVTTELAVAWTRTATAANPAYLARRMRVVRSFARYLQTLEQATEIPPVDLFPNSKHRPTPYIYTEADVAALMAAARELLPTIRAVTFETLIGLLATTGMRISEAMALDEDDVDWENGLLIVSKSKFGKSREVLLHPSTVEALWAYSARRDRSSRSPSAPSLFISTRGTRLSHETVQPTFRQLVHHVGLMPRSPSCRPRIHSFRH